MKLKRLVISCGGTGGHFNPGLSVAREFASQGGEVLLVLGGKNASAQALAAKKYNIVSECISAAPPISKNPLRLLAACMKNLRGMIRCRGIFKQFRPDALLAMGSFASFPPVIAAKMSGVPVFLHDGNARIGKANRFLCRFAKALAMSFPAVNAKMCPAPAILTGMPLRQEMVSGKMSKSDAVSSINRMWDVSFDPEKPVVLVFGGSLGATAINTKLHVDASIPELSDIQLVHLTGPGKMDEVKNGYSHVPHASLFIEGTPDIHILYSAADMVVCRSGGSTVSELAVYGKYAMLVPFPFAAEKHQDDNAAWLASAGGASIVQDSECSKEQFTSFLLEWRKNMPAFSAKGAGSLKLARPDAAAGVVAMIDNIISASEK